MVSETGQARAGIGKRSRVCLVRDGSGIVEAETKEKQTIMERLYSSAEISSTTCRE